MAVLIGGSAVTAQASPAQHLPDQPPKMHFAHPPQEHMRDFQQTSKEYKKMLSLLHIDERDFEREIRHGKSIADIARDRDIPVRSVVKLIERQMKAHIDEDKHEQRITPQQADNMKDHAREQAMEFVNRNHHR